VACWEAWSSKQRFGKSLLARVTTSETQQHYTLGSKIYITVTAHHHQQQQQ
jgi:hypothetical protein